MSKLYIQNLGLITTERCNLKCRHCMRGNATSKDMTDEVIQKLGQIDSIGNLTICGGEPTLALPTLEKVLTFIVDNKINLDLLTTIINGTNYSEEFLRLLDYIDEYIPKKQNSINAIFSISSDPYHLSEISFENKEEQYLENLERYTLNTHFLKYRGLNNKLYREGRAEELDEELTVPLKPCPIVYAEIPGNGVLEVGPLVTINVDGVVTDCNASNEHQRTLYNYGNILEENLETIIKRIGRELPPYLWDYEVGKILQKQASYNK